MCIWVDAGCFGKRITARHRHQFNIFWYQSLDAVSLHIVRTYVYILCERAYKQHNTVQQAMPFTLFLLLLTCILLHFNHSTVHSLIFSFASIWWCDGANDAEVNLMRRANNNYSNSSSSNDSKEKKKYAHHIIPFNYLFKQLKESDN